MQQLIVVIAFRLLGNGGSSGGKRIGTRLKLVSMLSYHQFSPSKSFLYVNRSFHFDFVVLSFQNKWNDCTFPLGPVIITLHY